MSSARFVIGFGTTVRVVICRDHGPSCNNTSTSCLYKSPPVPGSAYCGPFLGRSSSPFACCRKTEVVLNAKSCCKACNTHREVRSRQKKGRCGACGPYRLTRNGRSDRLRLGLGKRSFVLVRCTPYSRIFFVTSPSASYSHGVLEQARAGLSRQQTPRFASFLLASLLPGVTKILCMYSEQTPATAPSVLPQIPHYYRTLFITMRTRTAARTRHPIKSFSIFPGMNVSLLHNSSKHSKHNSTMAVAFEFSL